jgi:hypothetical protein
MSRGRRRGGPRRKRARPTPKWLSSDQIDQVARGRCLMLLSVLSGEKPVTDAIAEAGISRPSYYQLETRALSAMLRAMTPGASEEGDASHPQRRISELEEKVKQLERSRRRLERLLLMTRRLVRTAELRPKGRRIASTRSGKTPSPRSKPSKESATISTPSPTGGGER